jgi:murein DD-endopeptidase MepM/ murein hydrolase activator NlpD
VASALRNQQQAEDTLERAQRSQREAQVALTEARVVAERKLQDYALQVRQASLDERDAALTLADAKKRLDFVNADPTASNAARERARVAYEEQVLQVKELETHNKRLRADAEDAARKGVSGSDEVVAARQREKDAAQQVADAQQGLRDAQAAIAKAHRDGARQVQDAERRVAEAVAARTETELSSQQRIGDARARVAAALRSQTQAEVSSQERIGDARKRVAAALQSQSQTEAANQRRIGDAQRSVGRARQNAAEQAVNSAAAVANAQRGLRTALAGQADATDKVSASQQSLNEKMAALSPAGRQLVRTLAGLGPVFSRLQGDAQGGFFAGLTRGIGAALPAVPVLRRAVRGISDALGDVAAGFGQVVGGPAGRGFIAFVGRIAPPLIRQFGRIVGNLGSAFTDLMVAFAPVTNMIMRGLVRLSAKFADFAAGGGFQPLVDFMMQQGPGIVAIIGTIARAVGRLVVAAIPIGTVILRGLGGLAGVINRIPVPVLTGLVAVVGTLVAGIYGLNVALRIGTAVQNAAAVASKVWAAGQWLVNAALSANPIGLVVVAIAGLVAGFVIAYKKSETFRNIVNGALNGVKDAAVAVKNWFTRSFVPFFTDTIPNAFHATVNWVKRNWPVILAILTGPIGLATLFISRHWDTITNAFRAGRDWVMGAFRRSWDRVQAVFTSPVQAAVRVFRNLFGAGGTVRTLFRDAISAIGGIWGRLGGVMSGPVNWVIRNVINRLVDAVNWVSRKLNKGNILQHFGRVGGGGGGGGIASNPGRGALNPGFARGGVLPGYTPGKDVHTFHSATGGTLHLSGGEAVMRPEWTRAVGGAPAVQRMNDAARRGMRFAGGGVVWPTVGRRISTYRGHDGVDINQPPGPNFGAPIYAYRAGRITYTGWGRGYGDAVFEKGDVGPEVVYGHMSRVVARAKQRVRAGQTIGYVGETGNARGPHLHFGVPGGTYAGALALLRGATNVRGGSSGALGALQDLFDPLAAIIRRLRGIGRGAVPGGQIGRDLVGAVKDKVTDLATGWARGLVGTVGSAAGAVIGGNGAKAYAQKALASYGWGMAQWPALNALWEQESGWNPRADNPTSSAYGIPQALPGSKMATAGRDWRTNPATQIRWGLGYIRDRYGSPTGAMAHERARGWYDNGGVARGRGVMLKNTELPERVLSPQQTDTYDRLLPILERLERGNTGGSGPVRIILDAGGGVTLTGHIDNRIQGRAAQAATVGRQRR